MLPETDYRFILEFNDSQFIKLRTIKTGKSQILVQGSPKSPFSIPSAFFLESGNGYELHFCTVQQKKGSILHSWYRWYLG